MARALAAKPGALPALCEDTADAVWLTRWDSGVWVGFDLWTLPLATGGDSTKPRPCCLCSSNRGRRASLLPPACIRVFAMVDWLQEHTFCSQGVLR